MRSSKKGKLEFLEPDHVARLLQPLRDILRRPVVAGRAGSAIAAIRDRNVLKCPQVTEGALAGPRVEPHHRRRRGGVLRAGHVAQGNCCDYHGGDPPACLNKL